MSSPEILQRLSMLKDHCGMEIIVWGLQRFTSYEFLHPLPPLSVALAHLLKLFVIQLFEHHAPIRLILLKESLEFRVHRASFLCVTSFLGHLDTPNRERRRELIEKRLPNSSRDEPFLSPVYSSSAASATHLFG